MRTFSSVVALLAAWCLATVCASLDTASPAGLERRDTPIDTQTNQSSTFIYEPYANDPNRNFTYSIRYVEHTGDVYFRMSCPDAWSWVAVGFGRRMEDSLMFVVYKNTKGDDFILSPRFGTGHVEPSYDPESNLKLEMVTNLPSNDEHPNGVRDDHWFVAAKCPNCTASLGVGSGVAKPDWTNSRAEMIFAFGPPHFYPRSDALDAPLRRHEFYGHYNIDLQAATVTTTDANALKSVTIPPLGENGGNSNMDGALTHDHEPASSAHAALMCFAFIIAFPAGVFAARILEKVKLHAALQGFGFLLVIAGMATGIYTSKYYNRSKHITNGHQIFGFIIIAFLLMQWIAGFLHHRHFVKNQAPLRGGLVIRIHKIIGPLVMAAGIINGAFGFRFALTGWNIVYAPIVIVVIILLIASVAVKTFFRRKRGGGMAKSSHVEGLGASGGYAQPPAFPSAPAAPYAAGGSYGAPPEPYQGAGLAPQSYQPYNNAAWDRSDIALQSLEPQHPKQMV